jgi:hypothetical protein
MPGCVDGRPCSAATRCSLVGHLSQPSPVFLMSAGQLRIGVVGAGIGDLTLALALRQRGLAANVYEQALSLREISGAVRVLFGTGCCTPRALPATCVTDSGRLGRGTHVRLPVMAL